jgi:hypothetical protein
MRANTIFSVVEHIMIIECHGRIKKFTQTTIAEIKLLFIKLL